MLFYPLSFLSNLEFGLFSAGIPNVENGSPNGRQGFSPGQYTDSMRLVSRNQSCPSGKYGVSTTYTSSMGDYDYPEIDNLDMSGAGEWVLL